MFTAPPQHEVRWLPDNKELGADITLYGNKIAITSIDEQLFVVVIESDNLTKSMKVIFDMLWEGAKQYRPKQNKPR